MQICPPLLLMLLVLYLLLLDPVSGLLDHHLNYRTFSCC